MDIQQNEPKTAKEDKPTSVSENGQSDASLPPTPQENRLADTKNVRQPVQQRLRSQQIHFANGRQVQAIAPPLDMDMREIVSTLGIQAPEALFLIIGGSNDIGEDFLSQPIQAAQKPKSRQRRRTLSVMDMIVEATKENEAPEPTREMYLTQLCSRGIVRTAANINAAIIDGGRQTGIMAMLGHGVADRDYQSTLIGVAPASKVSYPGSSTENGAKDVEPLDPNHTCFVLTEGQEWGDETKTMVRLAAALANTESAEKTKRKPVITILTNGGMVAKRQLLYSVRQGWPVIVIKGTGHLADEVAELWQSPSGFIPDPGLAEIVDEGKLHFLELKAPVDKFARLTEQLLSYHHTYIRQFELTELVPQTIHFPNNHQAQLVAIQPDTDPAATLQALGLKSPKPVLLLLGGSAEMNEAMSKFNFDPSGKYSYIERRLRASKKASQKSDLSQEVLDNIYDILIDADQDGAIPTVHSISMETLAQLTQLLRLGIGSTIADKEVTIIDGGRQTGIMALMGQAMTYQKRRFNLIGVTLASKVTYPSGPPEDSVRGGEPLDPNHTYFVLTQGEQWGDETETMFQLAAALAKKESVAPPKDDQRNGKRDSLVATLLINGDLVTKKQLIHSVHRGWPIIVIKGSGNLADELVQLKQKRPDFIADPDLAEIVAYGKLHILELSHPTAEIERVLTRLLNEQQLRHQQADVSSIGQAWKNFGTFDAAANRQQREFRRLQFWMLVLGVLGTFLALTKQSMAQLHTSSEYKVYFDAILGSYYTWLDNILFYVILVIPIMITALAAAFNEFSAGKKWTLLRASAESIKKEIYRYRAKSDIYSDQATENETREVKLGRRINTIQANLMTGEAKLAALPDYRGPIPPMYAAHPEDDGLSFLTPDRYLPLRLADQYNYYKAKTIKLQRQLIRLQWIIYIVGGAGTLLVALGLELWIALTTALVSAFTTYMEYQQVENTLIRYNKTATDLNRIMVWWEALTVEEQADPKNVDKLVERTETVIHSEHAAWVQEMQDVIDEMSAQQRAKEEDKEEEDKKAEQERVGEVEDLLKLFDEEEIEKGAERTRAETDSDETTEEQPDASSQAHPKKEPASRSRGSAAKDETDQVGRVSS